MRCRFIAVEPAERAIRAISRKEGEFSLLLDEQFDILWHSDSLTAILGWRDVIGRNGTEFVHPDDLELVLDHDVAGQRARRATPARSDVRSRIVRHPGRRRGRELALFETTTWNHLDDPNVQGVLCTCRRVHDRSDLAAPSSCSDRAPRSTRSCRDRSARRPLDRRRRGQDRRLPGSDGDRARHRHRRRRPHRSTTPRPGGERRVVCSEPPRPDRHHRSRRSIAGGRRRRWPRGRVPGRLPRADRSARRAREIIGAMVAWGTSTIDFQDPPQSPIHVALRLAALPIADRRTEARPCAGPRRTTRSPGSPTGPSSPAASTTCRTATSSCSTSTSTTSSRSTTSTAIRSATRVLVEVGRRIAAVIGADDLVGRLGGDEFAVVCAGTNDPVHGRAVADRIVNAIRHPFIVDGSSLRSEPRSESPSAPSR